MLRLKTPWGMYILANANRIDIFPSKTKDFWEVYLCIDSYKHILHGFESERDALVFSSLIRDDIYEMFLNDDNNLWDITDSINSALHETEKPGLAG